MFSVISSSMSAAISRFITYELGYGDKHRICGVFCTSLWIQAGLGIVIVLLAETIGLWFLNTKMTIPASSLSAANWVYQFTIFTFILELINVPYTGLLIAHERMKVFAYTGIVVAIAKLLTAIIISLCDESKLIIYGALLMTISMLTLIFYRIYCSKNFTYIVTGGKFKKKLFHEISSFAGWNFFGAIAGVLRDQGTNLILNVFFGPIVNTARGIALQVSSFSGTLSGNFMSSLNPQITKSYAANDHAASMDLVFMGARMGFFLMFIISLPLLFNTSYIISLWLGEIPEYTSTFVRIILLVALIDIISGPLMTIMLANGKIRNYQIIVGGWNLMVLPIGYLVLKHGCPPESILIVTLIVAFIALFLRLFLLKFTLEINIILFCKRVFSPIAIVALTSPIMPLAYMLCNESKSATLYPLISCLISIISSIISIYFFGLRRNEKAALHNYISKHVAFLK